MPRITMHSTVVHHIAITVRTPEGEVGTVTFREDLINATFQVDFLHPDYTDTWYPVGPVDAAFVQNRILTHGLLPNGTNVEVIYVEPVGFLEEEDF